MKLCLACASPALPGQSRCAEHFRKRERERHQGVRGGKWRNTRRRILRRDGYRCVMCGSPDNLSVDHIIPRVVRVDNRDHNLRTLCQSCHDKVTVHGRRVPAPN
jgi:5-methylcytosine-specific restriction protein A